MPQFRASRLSEAYEASGDPALKAAADVARGVHDAGQAPAPGWSPREVRDLKQREAEALDAWARQHDRMLVAAEFEAGWRGQGCIGGQENDVFLKGTRVFKRNNLVFHLCYADFFDRLVLHNFLFPGAPLRWEGFVDQPDGLWPVMSQPVVRARRGARRQEVSGLMKRLGFSHVRNDDYRHPEGILVEDLHNENVFLDEAGEIVVIDPVIYLTGARPSGKRSSGSVGHPSRSSLSRS